MYSILEQIIENKLLVFKHLGALKNFEEQPIDEKKQSWTNAMESYQVTPNEKGAILKVKVDTAPEYIDVMKRTFPKALRELKNLVENAPK